jgi:hypothetical protein
MKVLRLREVALGALLFGGCIALVSCGNDPRESSPARVDALEEMNGTNALERLVKQMGEIERLESKNKKLADEKTKEIALVFEKMGTNARPILPFLINELRSGRNPGLAAHGIRRIGDPEGGVVLAESVTNADEKIRNAALWNLSAFKSSAIVATSAVPALMARMSYADSFSRAFAVANLGKFKSSPERVIPALLEIAEKDEDVVVRHQAIKAIGAFGSAAKPAEPQLTKIMQNDSDPKKRETAERALKAIRGEIDPEGQHVPAATRADRAR